MPVAPDPNSAPPENAVPAPPPGARDKVRIRFRKDGSLRLLSHHDLLRTFERMLRRANLPFYRTQGFHPHPRLIFALSLPLGVVGRDEVVELELSEELSPEEVHARLARQVPPGLAILNVRRIGVKESARVRGLCYGLNVPAERVEAVRQRAAELLAAPECWVERTRPPCRRIDLRPILRDVRILDAQPPGPGAFVEVSLYLTDSGTARPDEIMSLLGLQDVLDAGGLLERTRLELDSEATT